MKKEKNIEEQPEVLEEKVNPVSEIIKSIRDLPQVDRLVLYNRLDVIINHDREKASHGADGGTYLFDEAINSL